MGVNVDPGVRERHDQRKMLKHCHVKCFTHSSETGEGELRLDVPDSITTWVTEAVGLSKGKGLGLAKRAELRTFKPFFVEFTLPYSLIRGEQTKVPLTVYNYLPTCAEVSRRTGGVAESGQGQRSRVPHLRMQSQICCGVPGVFSAEIDVIEPHDVEAGLLTVGRVLLFMVFVCRWSQTGLTLSFVQWWWY